MKEAYAAANRALGNIVKVTPSSKVVGDLANFMVANNLDDTSLVERAGELTFPTSVIEFMQARPLPTLPGTRTSSATRSDALVRCSG